ncbi:MAG TPA: glycosyltransferase family 39 protein [Polyangia bacterium]|nr:glycosyltransferase family 39 protein [Polyangia bacterium]
MPGRWALGVVLAVAAAVRVAALACDARLPLFSHYRLDSLFYDRLARALAAGDLGLGGQPFHLSPLYTCLLGVVYFGFGSGPWPIRIVQLLIGLGTVALIYQLARMLFGESWALACGLAAALYGPLIFYDGQLLSDGLATFLHALVLLGVVRVLAQPTRRTWLLLGLFWGLCAVTRASALVLPVWLAIFWAPFRPRWQSALLLAGGVAAVILPVALRNRLAAGELIPITDSGGLNFYIGNGPGANGTFRVPPELPGAVNADEQFKLFRAAAEKASGRPLLARQVDAFWTRRALASIAAAPAHWLRIEAEKVWLFWNAREIPNSEDYSFMRRLNPVLALPLVQAAWILPLALVGTLALLASRRPAERYLGLTNLVICLSIAAFFMLARYRLVAVPSLLLAAVACLERLRAAWAARAWRRLALGGAALVPACALALAPKLPKPLDDEYFKLGYAYHVQAQPEAAERAYRQALSLNPDHISAHKNLGVLYQGRGDRTRARVEWSTVARLAQATGQAAYGEDARRHLAALEAP